MRPRANTAGNLTRIDASGQQRVRNQRSVTTPRHRLCTHQDNALLFRQVEALPPDQQRVIVLRFAEGRAIKAIAAELGRSEGAVKQLQLRALQTLRARLGERR